tara:strand:+ start:4425 stop:5012 length:588 start_codon:yes stop_codon:yes gene_type:complete
MKQLRAIVIFLLISLPMATQAAWQLDNDASSVSFNSIKNGQVVESHYFKSINGSIEANQASVSIDLSSVETAIGIRNERMQAMLFETGTYPVATITAILDREDVAALQSKATSTLQLPITIELHGQQANATVPVLVTRSADRITVSSQRPVIIQASTFKLAAGIEALRKIAGLQSITLSVPVSFSLNFEALQLED